MCCAACIVSCPNTDGRRLVVSLRKGRGSMSILLDRSSYSASDPLNFLNRIRSEISSSSGNNPASSGSSDRILDTNAAGSCWRMVKLSTFFDPLFWKLLWAKKTKNSSAFQGIIYITHYFLYGSVQWTLSLLALSTISFLMASLELLILAERGLPFQALNISINEPLLFAMYGVSLCEIFGFSRLARFVKSALFVRKSS